MIAIRVEGLRVLQRQLNAIADTGGRPGPVLRKAAREAIKPVVLAARELVPRDTGALRENIQVAVRLPRKGSVLVSAGMKITRRRITEEYETDDAIITVTRAPDASYRWHFIEFGRQAAKVIARRAASGRTGNTKGGSVGDGAVSDVPAQPFIRPAWDMHRGRLVTNFAEHLRRGIARAIRAQKAET